jgi:hypothetical protein
VQDTARRQRCHRELLFPNRFWQLYGIKATLLMATDLAFQKIKSRLQIGTSVAVQLGVVQEFSGYRKPTFAPGSKSF